MTSFSDRIPTYRKISSFLWKSFLGLFTWRRIRRLLLAGAVVITILAIFYTEEDWRGRRDWEAYKAQMKQEGVPFTREEMQPPPVPDDQNFAMTPSLVANQQQGKDTLYPKVNWDVLGSIVAYNTDLRVKLSNGQPIDLNELAKPFTQAKLIEAMKQFDPVLDEFTAASHRPAARFPENFSLVAVFRLAQDFQLRAVMELANAQNDRAADDVVTIFRISRHLTQGDTLTAQLISCADAIEGNAVLQYGLIQHRWTTEQLAAMQGALEQIDYVAALKRGYQEQQVRYNDADLEKLINAYGMPRADLHMYMSYKSELFDKLTWTVWPSGWIDQSLVAYNQDISGLVSAIDVQQHKIDSSQLDKAEFNISHRSWWPEFILAHILEPHLGEILQGGAMDILRLDEAKAACALERYRLANGKLPEKLDDLVPQFITKIPTNVATGGPFHYQKLTDDHYQLFALGWGEKEDGSQVPGKASVIWNSDPAINPK